MPKALYPGSFDPITYGHLDIVKRARKLFSELVVAVVHNPNKSFLLSPSERRELVLRALSEENLHGISVITFEGLLVDLVRQERAQAVIRGLRVSLDFENEFQMALTNRDLEPGFESVYLMASREVSFISSSIVKEIKMFGGNITRFVPRCVDEALEARFRSRVKP